MGKLSRRLSVGSHRGRFTPQLTTIRSVHPIERLRYMASTTDLGTAPLVREAASALAACANDPMELVVACRQLIDHRPESGALVWLSARMITGADPRDEAWDAVDAIERDTTVRELAHCLPAESTVLVIGAPELSGAALAGRADVEVLAADTTGEGYGLIHQLHILDHDAHDVPPGGIGAAVGESQIVLLEAAAFGPEAALVRSGSLAAAAVAHHLGVAVWLVAGVGRCLPERMWNAVRRRVVSSEPWDDTMEVVPHDLIDQVLGPAGPQSVSEACRRIDCPVAPELF